MNKPIKYRGRFIVTTKGNKPLAICCSIEQAEYWLESGRRRRVYKWINDPLRNKYGYVLYCMA